MDITIPHKFTPRWYQIPLFEAIERGIKRVMCVWHRRSGKDKALFNLIIRESQKRVGIYYYFFPTYTQGKKVIWDGIDNDGFKFLDHIPKELIVNKNKQELKIELRNGSIIQIVGTDKYDAVRGSNPVGCVFSEFAFQNPMAWEVVRPILAVNGGWAVFNSTPNGKNHFHSLSQNAKDNPKWFVEVLTASDTDAVPEGAIDEDRDSGMDEDMIEQEYFCSFDIGARGAYYTEQINIARQEGRIGKLPIYKDRGVDIYFDLGINDMMVMWFVQEVGQNLNMINYFEYNNKGMDFYYRYIDEYIEEKGVKLGKIYLPHDGKKRELLAGISVLQATIDKYGEGKVEAIPIAGLMGGINATRAMFAQCWFDIETCKQGINTLENYQKEWDPIGKIFRNTPNHNWASHGADCFRQIALRRKNLAQKEVDIREELGIIDTRRTNQFCNF